MRLDPDNTKCRLALKKAKKCEELKGNYQKPKHFINLILNLTNLFK